MKILITGFDPFDGAEINPSWEAVKRICAVPKNVEIKRLLLPTVYSGTIALLKDAMTEFAPDAVLGFGFAGSRKEITIERLAVNLADARIPDNSGAQPIDEPLFSDGPSAYFSTLPVKSLTQAINDAGLQASLSMTAGLFVCNCMMSSALYYAEKLMPDTRAGFIHLPGWNRPDADILAAETTIKVISEA